MKPVAVPVEKIISDKKNIREKQVNVKTKNIELDADKKKKEEERIELMTQFMLDPTSSATKLLEKRREMYELQEALQRDKDKFTEKEGQFKKTEEELRNRDEEFHKKIVEYYKNSFEKKIKDNYNYNNKLQEEHQNQTRLTGEIGELEQNNEKLKADLEKLKLIHESLKKYEEYLREVKEKHPDSFNDIGEIINKYENLTKIYNDLKSEEDKIRTKMKLDADEFRKRKQNLESNINKIISETAEIQKKIKETKDEKKKLENTVNLFEAKSNSVVSSLEQILLAIENIYSKCREKNDWTKHDIDKKEKKEKKGYKHEYQDRGNIFIYYLI